MEAAGHDVLTVVAVLPAAPDDDVMALAIAEGRVIVMEDKDFGELAFRDGYRPPSMIRLALPGYQPAEKAIRLSEVLASEGDAGLGHAIVVEPGDPQLAATVPDGHVNGQEVRFAEVGNEVASLRREIAALNHKIDDEAKDGEGRAQGQANMGVQIETLLLLRANTSPDKMTMIHAELRRLGFDVWTYNNQPVRC